MSDLLPEDFLNRGRALASGEVLVAKELRRGYAGVVETGFPVAVFPVDGRPQPMQRIAGKLRIVVACDVQIRSMKQIETTSAVSVTCLDPDTLSTFCRLVSAIDRDLVGASREARSVVDTIREWERLFRVGRRLGQEEEVGLWGELSFIQAHSAPERAIVAWRGPQSGSLDFVSSELAIEVKSSLAGHVHRSSVEQIRSGDVHPAAYLLSLWLAEDQAGDSLPDMVRKVRSSLFDCREFDRRLARTGFSDADALLYERRFVVVGDPILVHWARIPRVREIDDGVRRVRFSFEVDELEGEDDWEIAFAGYR